MSEDHFPSFPDVLIDIRESKPFRDRFSVRQAQVSNLRPGEYGNVIHDSDRNRFPFGIQDCKRDRRKRGDESSPILVRFARRPADEVLSQDLHKKSNILML